MVLNSHYTVIWDPVLQSVTIQFIGKYVFIFLYTTRFWISGMRELPTADMGGDERGAWKCLPLGEKWLNTYSSGYLSILYSWIVHLHIARKNVPLCTMTMRCITMTIVFVFVQILRTYCIYLARAFYYNDCFFHSGRSKYYLFMNYNLHVIY